MIAARIAAAGRPFLFALLYALLALVLGWTLGGQAISGRIDADLAAPLLMPGALLLAWLMRGEQPGRRAKLAVGAIGLLLVLQLALHLFLAGRVGPLPLFLSAVAAILCWLVADGAVQLCAGWRRRFRWPLMIVAVAGWFAVGQGMLAWHHGDRAPSHRAEVVMLTSLPLRWSGGGDIAQMLAAGPGDLPALAAIERAVDLRLVDSTGDYLPPGATLFLAHPRALAPADLVRIDQHLRIGGKAVILADGLSSWPPPHPLGDPRNPPVTSLLTPLFDYWGIELAAPAPGAGNGAAGKDANEADVFIDPAGYKLRLHSPGRFVRLPESCRSYGGERVARCPIGRGTVWLVSDADMLHASQWTSPVAAAPWLRRADNVAWLIDVLRDPNWSDTTPPLWIRPRGH